MSPPPDPKGACGGLAHRHAGRVAAVTVLGNWQEASLYCTITHCRTHTKLPPSLFLARVALSSYLSLFSAPLPYRLIRMGTLSGSNLCLRLSTRIWSACLCLCVCHRIWQSSHSQSQVCCAVRDQTIDERERGKQTDRWHDWSANSHSQFSILKHV